MREERRGFVYGLAAAASFGLSAPVAKRLLEDASPQMLAGLLYLGAAIALGAAWHLTDRRREAQLSRRDLPRLAVVTLTGGVLAPVLLLLGLERIRGITGSLLLNLEAPLTLLIAVLLFREHLSRQALTAALVIFLGGALVTTQTEAGGATITGGLLLVAACAGWAIDNNVTQALTLRDPLAIVFVKTSVAATVNIGIAVLRGSSLPHVAPLLAALALGTMSYGVSVLLDAYALRLLGAAREAAIFASAPFAGAIASIFVLHERVRALDVVGAAVMAFGVVIALTELHEHAHDHERLEHEHAHVHDVHHQHDHLPGTPVGEPHTHAHIHVPTRHAHPHVSDLHHRHSH
jgi:drug/metabolite transporter (DMT)-like permease